MNAPGKTFQDISEGCVRDFLQTVVVIDDQAFRLRKGQTPKKLEAPGLPSSGSAQQGQAPSQARQEAEDKLPEGTVQQEGPAVGAKPTAASEDEGTDEVPAFDLDAQQVVRLFAQDGVVCAVLEPQEPIAEGDLLRDSMPAARRADALILDWRIHDTDGDHALSIIKAVLRGDQRHSGRLRLILIYTAEPDLNAVYERLQKGLTEDQIVTTTDIANFVLSNTALRITVLAKPTALLRPEWKKQLVDLPDLPGRLVKEFTNLTRGLVANVALRSLGVLRNQTHTLLAQMGQDMDPAFLTHRTLLPNPNDSIEHVAELVSGEISALLQAYEVGNISDAASVEAWIRQGTQYTLNNKSLTIDQVIKLVRDGRAAASWEGEEGAKSFTKEFGVGKPKLREHLTKMLALSHPSPENIDHQFTVFTSMVRRYEASQPAPWLRLGAILQSEKNPEQYLVCVQPSCHCVRLCGISRAFLFAPSVTHAKVDLEQTVPHDKSFRSIKLSLKSYELEKIVFAPNGTEDVVRAQQEGVRYFFRDVSGIQYAWVGQLKDMYAQRVANRLGSGIAEVALNEYEWARK